jgi:hypothetical protein
MARDDRAKINRPVGFMGDRKDKMKPPAYQIGAPRSNGMERLRVGLAPILKAPPFRCAHPKPFLFGAHSRRPEAEPHAGSVADSELH